MARFQIVSDSSCDLGWERAEQLGVTCLLYTSDAADEL